jgi:hypothetical protein
VFLSPSCRETAKNAIKKIKGKNGRESAFFSIFRQNVFDGVF